MAKNPYISVIMSVHNAESSLSQCIDSVLSQSFKNFEFIIVNDKSTDTTLKIIRKYAHKDGRIKIINNNSNLGLTKSLNIALDRAKGKYIVRIDSDDLCMPNRFEVQKLFLDKNKEVFLVGSNAFLIDEIGNQIGKTHLPIANLNKKLIKKNCIFHPSIMFRNDGSRYREKFYYSQDYDFYLQAIASGKVIINLPEYLIYYRKSKSSISYSKKSRQKAFAEYAKLFYRQKINKGNDKYPDLSPSNIINLDYLNDPIILYSEIKVGMLTKNKSKVIKYSKMYLRNFGFSISVIIYLIMGLLPDFLLEIIIYFWGNRNIDQP